MSHLLFSLSFFGGLVIRAFTSVTSILSQLISGFRHIFLFFFFFILLNHLVILLFVTNCFLASSKRVHPVGFILTCTIAIVFFVYHDQLDDVIIYKELEMIMKGGKPEAVQENELHPLHPPPPLKCKL